MKKYWLLIIVIILTAGLRLFQLTKVPPSLSWDEAAIGWNAKTIFHTRRDEYGTLLPISFKSFGDYKSPAYIYLTAPVVGLFGLNPITIRLVSVLAGVFSVVTIYFLTQELLPKSKHLPILSAFLLSLTPWHILMSRPAFEPNLALLFVLLDIWFFLKGLKNSKWLYLSAFFFATSLYTYHSPKIFSVLFLIPLIILFRKKLFSKKQIKHSLLALGLAVLLLIPLVKDTLSGGATRFQATSIFSIETNQSIGLALAKNYFSHFSPQYLFLGNLDIPRIQVKNSGLLLFLSAPFLIIGLISLIKNYHKSWAKVLLFWLSLSPVPAMIGFEAPHPIRSFNLLPALIIITAIGIHQVKPRFKPIIIGLFFINSLYFFQHYLTAYPVYSAPDWQYGYEKVSQVAKQYHDQVDKIIITSHYSQPHIFTLVYQNQDPQKVFWGSMIKYLYRDINYDTDKKGIIENDAILTNLLIIGSPQEIPENAKELIQTINFPDNTPAFRIIKT